MSHDSGAGTTAFDRLRDRYDHERTRCRACGYTEPGGWRAETAGDRVRYTRECPSCGEVERIELRF